MDIKLQNKEKFRIKTGDSLNDLFIDIYAKNNSSDKHYNEGYNISLYDMHQIFIIKKEREIKIFIFRREDDIIQSDFGYYRDGEILFTNSEII